MSLRNKTLWSVSSQLTNACCNLLWFIFISRSFNQEQIGQYVVSYGIFSIIYTFTSFSPQVYLTQSQDWDSNLKENCMGVTLISLGVSTLFSLVSALILNVMSMSIVALLVLIFMLKPFVMVFDVLPQSYFSRNEMFKPLAISSIFTSSSNLMLSVLFVWKTEGIEGLAYAQVLSSLVGVVVSNLNAKIGFVKAISFNRISELFNFARKMVSVNGIAYCTQKVSELLIASLLGYAALGIYSRAVQISETVFQNVYGAFTRVAFSRMCNEYREGISVEESYNFFKELIMVVVGPLLINVAILSAPIVYFVLGERWLDASAPLKILLLSQLVIISYGMNWEILVLQNQLHIMAKYESAKSIILLVGILCGSYYSLIGIAMGKMLESAFGYHMYSKKLGEFFTAKHSLLSRSTIIPICASVLPTIIYVSLEVGNEFSANLLIVSILSSIILWAAALGLDKKSVVHKLVRYT